MNIRNPRCEPKTVMASDQLIEAFGLNPFKAVHEVAQIKGVRFDIANGEEAAHRFGIAGMHSLSQTPVRTLLITDLRV